MQHKKGVFGTEDNGLNRQDCLISRVVLMSGSIIVIFVIHTHTFIGLDVYIHWIIMITRIPSPSQLLLTR